ncbi:MAG: hypothetical protein A2Z14_00985 [Chloroflexi bacterium RBG_16_48_8]|nr:MAG: hypothetical protein A2Z14_00985 [Chloroflexi bacterium RBG_16_48_8]
MDVAVFDAIQHVIDGSFEGGVYVGTLLNEGVGITPFHQLDAFVSEELKAELDQVRADIMAGKLQTGP